MHGQLSQILTSGHDEVLDAVRSVSSTRISVGRVVHLGDARDTLPASLGMPAALQLRRGSGRRSGPLRRRRASCRASRCPRRAPCCFSTLRPARARRRTSMPVRSAVHPLRPATRARAAPRPRSAPGRGRFVTTWPAQPNAVTNASARHRILMGLRRRVHGRPRASSAPSGPFAIDIDVVACRRSSGDARERAQRVEPAVSIEPPAYRRSVTMPSFSMCSPPCACERDRRLARREPHVRDHRCRLSRSPPPMPTLPETAGCGPSSGGQLHTRPVLRSVR